MVQDGLKYFDESVEKVRFAIVYIFGNKTKSRLSYFKEQCKLVDLKYRKIPLEVETRWNYTYLMLTITLEYQNPINSTFNHFYQDVDYLLTEGDWFHVDRCCKLLGHFYSATVAFSSQYSPSICDVLPYLANIAKIMFDYKDDPGFQVSIFEMRSKFKKYYFPIPLIFYVGCILNPSMKKTVTENLIHLMYDWIEIDESFETPTVEKYLEDSYNKFLAIYHHYIEMDERAKPSAPTSPSGSHHHHHHLGKDMVLLV